MQRSVLVRWLRDVIRALCISSCIAALACKERSRSDEARFPGDTTGIVRPAALSDLASHVRQLNAIVLADVRDISANYDRCEGPRTILHLRNARSLLGSPHTDSMTLRVFGGPVPGGRYAHASESPRYVAGGRYLLFLFNTDWRFSPVMGSLAFRVENIAGREVLLSPDGQGVTGVSTLAVETQTPMLALPAGLPGLGTVVVSRTPAAQFVPCSVNANGTPKCPRLPVDSLPPRETFTAAEPWIPRPTAEDVARTITVKELVFKIDSVAKGLGAKPGGYFARKPRLECWDAIPTRKPRQ